MPSRRTVLRRGVPALLAASAGCQYRPPLHRETRTPTATRTPFDTPGRTTPGPPTRTATGDGPHPPGTLVDVGGATVGVRSLSVRVAAVYSGAWMTRLANREGHQYLVADVVPSGDGDAGPQDRFSLSMDGRRHEPGVRGSGVHFTGQVLFELPADVDPSRGRLTWTGPDGTTVTWAVPDARLRELRLSPSFSVSRFASPGVERTGDHEVTVELVVRAANDGERAGQFVGVVHLPTNDRVADLNPSAVVSFPLERGGAATWHRRVRWPYPDHDTDRLGLASAGGGASADVMVP